MNELPFTPASSWPTFSYLVEKVTRSSETSVLDKVLMLAGTLTVAQGSAPELSGLFTAETRQVNFKVH